MRLVKEVVAFCLVMPILFHFGIEGGGEMERKYSDPILGSVSSGRNGPFIENEGQWDEALLFVAVTSFGHVGISRGSVFFDVREGPICQSAADVSLSDPEAVRPGSMGQVRGHVIEYSFDGANDVVPVGTDPLPYYHNYFLGSDSSKWKSGVECYGSVLYRGLWGGVDIRFHTVSGGPKYDLILHPGADPDSIRISVRGQEGLTFDGRGMKALSRDTVVIEDGGLVSFYTDDREALESEYVRLSEDTFGFSLPAWKGDRGVIIDPLVISTYLGGGSSDGAYDIGVDGEGNVIVFGSTYSSDFPTVPGSYDTQMGGSGDLIVSMMDQTGSDLVFSTFIGGSNYDYYYYYGGMEVLADGILFCGITGSSDYPTTTGSYDRTLTGSYDCVFSKISMDGQSLMYSSYFGGSSYEYAYEVCGSSDGAPCLLGTTYSSDLPLSPGAFQSSLNGMSDCFVARFDRNGTSLEMSTYLGGSGADYPQRVRDDGNGNLVVSGNAGSSDFPMVAGGYDTTSNGGSDCFVNLVRSDGKALLASTFLGGSNFDVPHGMSIDQSGSVSLFGYTLSTDFPTTAGTYKPNYIGGGDGFVTVLSSDLSTVVASTFFGGSGEESPMSIELDMEGRKVVSGVTESNNMETTPDAEDRTFNGIQDFFLTILSEDLKMLDYSTYFGGSYYETGGEACIDPMGKIVVGGRTNSTDMAVMEGAFQEQKEGSNYYTDSYIFGIEYFTVSEPLTVLSLRTYEDINCTVEKGTFDLGEKVYLELRGTDANASRRDGAMINISFLKGSNPPIRRVLVETDKDTGVFRGSLTVPPNAEYLDTMRAVSRKDPTKKADVLIDYPFRPSPVLGLTLHDDPSFTNRIDKADLGQTVFIKALGMDTNPMKYDKAFVTLSSDRNSSFSPLIVLAESGLDTGAYLGQFQVPSGMSYFENVTVRSMETPERAAVLMVHTPLSIRSDMDPTKAMEDEEYEVSFWNFGYMAEQWSVEETAYWLEWDGGNKRLHGTPANLEVGTTDVTIYIWDGEGHDDQWDFRINIGNEPPIVLTENVVTALEDHLYSVNYESDDDPGGRTEWYMTTNASFLTLDRDSGEVRGTPINEDVGTYYVALEVKDGNGGSAAERFNLTVLNQNDRPFIVTTDIRTVMQDDYFIRDYEVSDEDAGDRHIWTLMIEADWLAIDPSTGVLNGTPRAKDVGPCTVNVSVTDIGGLTDSHEYRLEVLDRKDRPYFVDLPVDPEVVHGQHFIFDVNATDDDEGSVLEYSISKSDPPSDIDIDPETGMMDWIASVHFLEDGKGTIRITVKVSDGELFSTADFELRVLPTLSPSCSLLSPIDGERTSSEFALLRWSGEDPEGETLTYSVYIGPDEDLVLTHSEAARHSADISRTSLNLTNLTQGTIYFWTIVPYDTCTYGVCTSGTLSFRVNGRPAIGSIPLQKVAARESYSFDVAATDPDPEDLLSFSILNPPEGMKIDGRTGRIDWTPGEDQVGEWTVRVRASDGIETTEVTFSISVIEEKGMDPLLIAIGVVFGFMAMIILVLVILLVRMTRRMSAVEGERKEKKEEAERIAMEIEELKRERRWEQEHYRAESPAGMVEIGIQPPVPTTPQEAHMHDKEHGKPTYEELYGERIPEESEEQMDKVLKDGLEEMEEEEPEEDWGDK